jgi:L-threonylcarbamoyladenylate synthase
VAPPVISHLDETAVRRAAEILGNGGIVALPTETVYGLGASIGVPQGIKRVFEVKGRPTNHPLIVHGSSTSVIDEVGLEPSPLARLLARSVWPGPLSLLIPRHPALNTLVTGGLQTVVVRVPAHRFIRDVADELGCGIAAPSANRFGQVSPTTALHVVSDLGDDVDLVVDGGPSVIGLESTIVDTTVSPPQILRHGGIPVEDLESLTGLKFSEPVGLVRAPGMLAQHYSPKCRLHLAESTEDAYALLERLDPHTSGMIDALDPLSIYAATLYGSLRACDDRLWTDAVVVLPPNAGLGRAIRDRLRRAAVPRER